MMSAYRRNATRHPPAARPRGRDPIVRQVRARGLTPHGFTLVELMVALTVSLLLLAGVIQVYVSSKQAYRVQDNVARIQESGRLAMGFLTRYLRLAGYRSNLQVSSDQVFTSGVNQVISGTHGGGSPPTPPDTVTINFQSDGTMVDCLGNTVDNGFLSRDTFQLSNAGELQCRSQGNKAVPTDNTQPLVGGIQDMQITYGLNNKTTDPPAASQYVTAADMLNPASTCPPAPDCWPLVVSIRITLLVQSPDDSLADTPQTYTFNGPSPITATDRRLRQVFTSTINLRNRTL